ncbi:hypothetical protein D3C73_1293770 [compost metagenome]
MLADQMGHHVQGIGERIRGFHVTKIVTFKPAVEGLLSFHMDTFVLLNTPFTSLNRTGM